MKKLSLRRVLNEFESELEKWSSNIETLPVERSIQKGATTAMEPDVQKVWGGPKLEDDDLPPPGERNKTKSITHHELANRYNLTPDDLEAISQGDFSMVYNRVGDLANFQDDVADVFGKRIADRASVYAANIKANAPMSLGSVYDKIQTSPTTQKPQTQPFSNTNHNVPMAHAPSQMTDQNIRSTPPELNPTSPGRKPKNR